MELSGYKQLDLGRKLMGDGRIEDNTVNGLNPGVTSNSVVRSSG